MRVWDSAEVAAEPGRASRWWLLAVAGGFLVLIGGSTLAVLRDDTAGTIGDQREQPTAVTVAPATTVDVTLPSTTTSPSPAANSALPPGDPVVVDPDVVAGAATGLQRSIDTIWGIAR